MGGKRNKNKNKSEKPIVDATPEAAKVETTKEE